MFKPESTLGIDIEETAKKIDSSLKKKGISTKQVSEALNLSYQAVNKWRKGQSLPEIQNLYILSQILGLKMDDLVVGMTVNVVYDVPNTDRVGISIQNCLNYIIQNKDQCIIVDDNQIDQHKIDTLCRSLYYMKRMNFMKKFYVKN